MEPARKPSPPALAPAALRRLRARLPAEAGRSARAARGGWPAPSRLRGAGPAGVDRAWSSAPHEGVARDLVAALKFRRLLPVAGLMAERIQLAGPGHLLSGDDRPGADRARARSLRRGFDPAGEIAAAARRRAGLPLRPCLARRGAGPPGRPAPRRAPRPPAADPRQR